MNERDRQLLINLCARLIRLRSAARGDERNNIDRELNAVRRTLEHPA